jgi:O-antigen/teichoic acid export membrane protein
MSVTRRLTDAFGASVLGPFVTLLVQVANVPVMLRYWGADLYGEWLLISTIPVYLLLTDLGFGNAAGSDMTMRAHGGDRAGAIETFQSISALVLTVSALLAIVLPAVIFLVPIQRMLHLTALSAREAHLTLLFLCLNCLVILQWSVILTAYRCGGHYAEGTLYVNIVRAVEGASFLALLVLHARPVELSVLMLGVSALGTGVLLVERQRLVPWLPLGVRHATWQRVRELAHPALAFMAFPLGNALSLQGATLVTGIVLGPLAVAVFNPMRTLSRAVFQLTDAVKNSVWPELSAAYGQGDRVLARRLHRTACQVALWLAVLATAVLAVAGNRIFAVWTHGRIAMDVPAFHLLLAVVLVNSTWNASSAVPMAANRHQRLAAVYMVCMSVSLATAYVYAHHFGLRGVAAATLLGDVGMSVYVVRMSNLLLDDHWPAFAAAMVDGTQLKILFAKLTRRLV